MTPLEAVLLGVAFVSCAGLLAILAAGLAYGRRRPDGARCVHVEPLPGPLPPPPLLGAPARYRYTGERPAPEPTKPVYLGGRHPAHEKPGCGHCCCRQPLRRRCLL